ncbi:MAG: hypothetical protein IJC29_00890 [Clostridia bacterium]|nr:hypothetical protein [Clostridia bacterium]
MKLFKNLFTLATLAAVVPYKVTATPVSEEEGAAKDITVESLTYRVDVLHKEEGKDGEVKITVPAEGIKRVIAFVRGKIPVVKEAAVQVKDKAIALKDKAVECKDKVVSRFRREEEAEEVPEEEITVEVVVTPEETATETAPAKRKSTRKKTTE